MKRFVLSLPLKVVVYKRKKDGTEKVFRLNLNEYRNTHHTILSKAKVNYSELIAPKLKPFKGMEFKQIKLVYRVYPQTKRSLDIANVCSIVDKFFCDVLQKEKVIINDNYNFLPKVEYCFGYIDKHNPRVEVELHELETPYKHQSEFTFDDADEKLELF